jgi:hypothetical protein
MHLQNLKNYLEKIKNSVGWFAVTSCKLEPGQDAI